MAKSISKNYLYNLSYQILTLLTPLITTPYLSRVLGPDGIGQYSFTFSIVTYFILLANLGVANYAQREIAYERGNKQAQSRTFFEVMLLRTILVLISLIAYYFIVSSWNVSHTIYWIQALNILAVLFDISWYFQGLEEFGKIVFRNFITRILSILMVFLLIKDSGDLNFYVALTGGMNILSGILIWAYLPQYLVHVKLSELNPFRNFIVILQMFLPTIAIQVYTVLDKTMIGLSTTDALENGYYEQAEKIVKISLTVITSLGTVTLPRIAADFASGNKEAIKKRLMKSYRFATFLALPMIMGLIATIDFIVPWFFGPGYEKVGILVKIFSGLLLAIGINNVTGVQYLVPTNRQNLFTLTVIIGAAVNFCLNLFLIPYFYSVGAAIASVMAESVIAIIQLWLVRKEFSSLQILKNSIHYLIGSGVMYACLILAISIFDPETVIVDSFVLIAFGGFIYFLTLLVLKDTFVIDILLKIKGRLPRRSC